MRKYTVQIPVSYQRSPLRRASWIATIRMLRDGIGANARADRFDDLDDPDFERPVFELIGLKTGISTHVDGFPKTRHLVPPLISE